MTTETDQRAIDEAEAQAWFDARPNIEHEKVSSVVRGNREPVWTIIFDRFFEMHKIAQETRAELRRNATVATAAGFVVQPDSLLMKSLANGDGANDIERGRFMISTGVSLAAVARRVVVEHESGNVAFRAADAFQLAGDGVRERDTEPAGGL
ncbi:hypothetical protein E3O45_05975 [Cryobacterium sp. TMS1-20-1]|uniref:hypothetical protein n=1 Tax=Cryobacterium sp. TMS1-20-1 TaxID=1259223 RepID=UPI00106AE5AC|nr:hypothetical protein [Cryobacterium sp. TMS1-20-1]TFC78160.1 hypothetical protein E3O45_05975 [Cryobacterium sp. TMS1-20-1]